VLLFAAAPLAAQWRVGADLGTLRFWGSALDTSASGDPGRARPSRTASYNVEIERRIGALGLGVGVLYSRGGVGVENAAVAIEEKGLLKLYEIAPHVALLLAKPGPGGELRVRVGPMFDRWSFTGGTASKRVGAHAAVSLGWPLGGPWTALVQAGVAVSACVFNAEDLPPTFARRATWRRGLAAGVRIGR
jgi:hypothetical protein